MNDKYHDTKQGENKVVEKKNVEDLKQLGRVVEEINDRS